MFRQINWKDVHTLGYTSERDRMIGRFFGILVFCLGLVLFSALGFFGVTKIAKSIDPSVIPMPYAIGMALLWVGIYLMFGIKFLEQRNFIVVERFGRFCHVKLRGIRILCFPGLIDKIVQEGTLEYQQLNLYENAAGQEVDFTDGTAAIEGHAFYRIRPGEITDIVKNILRFTYEIVNPLGRLRNLLDNLVRGKLQKLTIDKASKEKDGMWEKIKKEAVDDISQLEQIGLDLDDKRGIIITDIKLPEKIVQFREQKLQGKADAERATARGRGYSDSITILQEKLGISAEEAVALFNTQTGIEMLRETKPSMNLVAPGMRGVLASFDFKKPEQETE